MQPQAVWGRLLTVGCGGPMSYERRRCRRAETGAAAVEFALIAPLLLLLVFGIISYGYMLSFRQAMSQGAAEGARSAAVWATAYASSQDASRIASAKTQVDDALSSYGVSCTNGATCTVTIESCGTAKCARVTVSYPYS